MPVSQSVSQGDAHNLWICRKSDFCHLTNPHTEKPTDVANDVDSDTEVLVRRGQTYGEVNA